MKHRHGNGVCLQAEQEQEDNMVLPADQYKGYFKDSELTEEEKKKFKIDPKDAALLAADFIPVVSDVKAVYDFPEDMKFAGQLWEQGLSLIHI